MRGTKSLGFFAIAMLLFFTAGCENMRGREKEIGGTLVGAGLGALAGSQIGSGKGQLAAVALGTLAGAWLGSEVGRSLDKADQAYAERTTQYALEWKGSGNTAPWRNPDTGNSGTVTPLNTYQSAEGQPCRSFYQSVLIDGRQETLESHACRGKDGRWHITK